MAGVEDSREGRKAPVAALDDARKRRDRRPADQPLPHAPGAGDEREDCSAYALSLADSLLTSDSEPDLGARPEEPFVKHEAGASALAPPAAFEPDGQEQPVADEILCALQAEHQRADRSRPHRSRSTPATVRRDRKPRTRRRHLIARAAAALVVVVPVVVIASNTTTATSMHPDHGFLAATRYPIAALSTEATMVLGVVTATDRELTAKNTPRRAAPRAHRRRAKSTPARAITHHPSRARATLAATTASTSNAVMPAPVTTSDQIAAPTSTSSVSPRPTPAVQPAAAPATSPQSTTHAATQSQPAGPTGFGHVVGGNCNPQCR